MGTIPLSDSSKACMRAVRLLPSPAGLSRTFASGTSEVSRFSCMEFPDVHGVYAGPTSNSRSRCWSSLAQVDKCGGQQCPDIFRLDRIAVGSRCMSQRSGVDVAQHVGLEQQDLR